MKGFVSSRRFRVFALVALVSVLWVACSMFIPYGFPWVGLGGVGLVLTTALWLGMGSTRSIAQVLGDVEGEGTPSAGKSGRLAAPIWVPIAWLSLCPVLLSAGTPVPAANLSACKSGWSSCDRSLLTLEEMTAVANVERARNVSNCRSGQSSCDKWKLTEPEAIAVAVAVYDRNVSNCKGGFNPCDHSRLTRS